MKVFLKIVVWSSGGDGGKCQTAGIVVESNEWWWYGSGVGGCLSHDNNDEGGVS